MVRWWVVGYMRTLNFLQALKGITPDPPTFSRVPNLYLLPVGNDPGGLALTPSTLTHTWHNQTGSLTWRRQVWMCAALIKIGEAAVPYSYKPHARFNPL